MRTAFLGICVLGLTIGVSGQAPVKPSMQIGSATVTAADIQTTFHMTQVPPHGASIYRERTVFSGAVEIQTSTATIYADRAEQVGNGALELSGKVVFHAK